MTSSVSPDKSFAEIDAGIERLQSVLPEAPVLELQVLHLLRHVNGQFDDRISRALKEYALSPWDFRTLMMLLGHAKEGCTVLHLSALAGEKRTNMTRICDSLESRALIHRRGDTLDRRHVRVFISAKAQRLMRELLPRGWSRMAATMHVLSASELKQLFSLLLRISSQFDNSPYETLRSGETVKGAAKKRRGR